MEYQSLAEKQIMQRVEKMFGTSDPELKAIMHMHLMKELHPEDNALDADITTLLNKIRKSALEETAMINSQLQCTLDASGNVVLLK